MTYLDHVCDGIGHHVSNLQVRKVRLRDTFMTHPIFNKSQCQDLIPDVFNNQKNSISGM